LVKAHKIGPNSIRGIKDLSRLPQLEGTIGREQPHRLVAKSKVGSIVSTHQSSGTTGRPMRIYVSRDRLDALRSYNEIMSTYVGAHRNKISLVITGWNPTISNTLTDFAIVSKISPIRGRRFEKVIDDILYEHRLAETQTRVSVLYLDSARFIRVLTEEMLARGIDQVAASISC
jgi:phenylacetate-coenzyme A ligase PaaK-like adenylate-forming protein